MEWFVSAKRNNTAVKIPATKSIALGVLASDKQQSAECDRMAESLAKYGWDVLGIEAY